MNTYRVDRNDELKTPCGMNSILYIGDSNRLANKYFKEAKSGLNCWNKPDDSYGIILSEWNDSKRDYVVIGSKGFSK